PSRGAHLLAQLPQGAEDARPVETLPFAMFAVIHDYSALHNCRACTCAPLLRHATARAVADRGPPRRRDGRQRRGRGSASLRERLYCDFTDAKPPMQGILIYTASGDSEGSMGGLVR